MRQKTIRALLITLLLAAPALAQEMPHWEVFGGYSIRRSDMKEYLRSTAILYTTRNRYSNPAGWEASVTENVNRWFGGTLDISGHYRSPLIVNAPNRQQAHSILYGPRFALRTGSTFLPFAHVLLGAIHADVRVTPVGPHLSGNAFAAAIGGGVDMKLGRKIAVRVVQGDYFRTNVLGTTRPRGFRVSAGVVYRSSK